MGTITDAFALAFDDYNTSGVPLSGNKKVKKAEVRAIGPVVEALVDEAVESVAAALAAQTDVFESALETQTELVTSQLADLAEQVTTNRIYAATWVDGLVAVAGTIDGQGGEVLDSDTGTHLDATSTGYNGAEVSNAGIFKWVVAWSRWKRIGDTGLSAKADKVVVDDLGGVLNSFERLEEIEGGANAVILTPEGRLIQSLSGGLADTLAFERIDSGSPLAVITPTGHLIAKLDNSLSSTPVFLQPWYSIERARWWALKTGQLKAGYASTRCNLALIGDSWVDEPTFFLRDLKAMLVADFGNGGLGYLDAASNVTAQIDAGAVRTRSGWTIVDETAAGPSLYKATTSVGGSYVQFAVSSGHVLASAKLLYNATADGQGRYRWSSSDTWKTLAMTGSGFASATLTGFPTDGSAFEFRFESVSGSVEVFGLLPEETSSGVVLHKLGNAGTTSADWATVDQAQLSLSLAAVPMDAVGIVLGTNDSIAISADAYAANLRLMVEAIQAAHPATGGAPAVDIILIPSPDVVRTGPVDVFPYFEAALQVAYDLSLPLINLTEVMGRYPYDKISWFDGDRVHPSPGTGSVLVARHIANALS